ncbi:GUN4 domain-containing protein [Microcoleus sp. FACHB-672]|uniref:GUN4 domain-containing protein n=1 Tax=Microcoleus sp. FACHB-672 TaxID=2692825 RepID=UPI0016869A5A|nr:GUN4 domain-containing protein [Microcoleus sp. FACHB-672]MBD2041093.1 GUN4 domain-containing protein [Microcoleus sp. FACHB-672]
MLRQIVGGRYQIISHLGGGGFGTTFVAEDRHLPGNPRCVVKQLKPKAVDNPTALEAARRLFEREADVLYKLGSHNQIPRLFAHFEEDREFYLVQELIEGHELRQELPVNQQLSEAQVVCILREILEVLVFVHQQDVIHRDIKPSNLIRCRQDKKIVLIDFGAVKQLGTPAINSQGQTSFTIAIGSPGYMPSEQMAGKPRFSSDIYAVGMIGIQALTGLHPRGLPEDPNTCEIIWRDRAEVSLEFAKVIDKMVRYDFRERYQSAREVLEIFKFFQSRRLSTLKTIPVISGKSQLDLSTTKLIISDNLSSACGIDYSRLRNFLAAEEWKEADQETAAVMLKAAGREQEGFLRAKDIAELSCQDLQTIDTLWLKYSKGCFSFSIQQRLWEKVGGNPNANYETENLFADSLGWRVKENWLDYHHLIFNVSAPEGYLPRLYLGEIKSLRRNVPMDAPRMSLGDFFSRIKVCKLQEFTLVFPRVKPNILTNNLTNDQEINYTRLRDFLAVGQWKEADAETSAVMLKASFKEKEDLLTADDIEKFSCEALSILDELWVRYSKGHFGFSVQQRIWQSCGGKLDADATTCRRFGTQIGWFVKDNWLFYSDATFSLNAPAGHLPMCDLRGYGRKIWGLVRVCLLSRIEACLLQASTVTWPNVKPERQVNDTQRRHNSFVRNRIAVINGDITEQQVDAIVCATDYYFSGSGGVDYAIHRAAGADLREACRQLKGCACGEAKITAGYNLPAQWIIHTVGPSWGGGANQEEQRLAECYRNCLVLAEQYSIKTIAFPAISTGTFGFPMLLASRIAICEVKRFLESNSSIEKVIFVCFEELAYDCYLNTIDGIFR